MARELNLLVIDDSLDSDRPYQVINRWRVFQEYWLSTNPVFPDLILCDVNFERDSTSPLAGQKPTGFLYALPFLAVARASGNLCILEFHSGSIQNFSRESNDPGVTDEMRSLAAELVGTIHAMTADRGSPPLAGATEAWRWIKKSEIVRTSREDARNQAYVRYRQQLVKMCGQQNAPGQVIVVDPRHYDDLVKWAQTCQAAAPNDLDELLCKDPGVGLIRLDGSRDCISVRALFRDADDEPGTPFTPGRFDPITPPVGGDKLEQQGWVLRGEAYVGALIRELGFWPDVYRAAKSAVDELSAEGEPPARSFNDEIVPGTLPQHKLVRLLVMIFQIVRLHRAAHDQWEQNYQDSKWDPLQTQFLPPMVPGMRGAKTLPEHLRDLYAILRRTLGLPGDASSAQRVQEIVRSHGWPEVDGDTSSLGNGYIKFHLQLLAGLGLVKASSNTYSLVSSKVWRATSWTSLIPQCPNELLPEAVRSLRWGVARSLGFDADDNAGPLRRIPAHALYGGVLQEGTQFNADLFENNVAPSWLCEFARIYARELGWTDSSRWPAFMREKDDELSDTSAATNSKVATTAPLPVDEDEDEEDDYEEDDEA